MNVYQVSVTRAEEKQRSVIGMIFWCFGIHLSSDYCQYEKSSFLFPFPVMTFLCILTESRKEGENINMDLERLMSLRGC